ncbi:MAG: polyphenol oxidase family protein [bacterium]|nr:polyphenol oxidase family protein [bacterium]
MKSWLRTAPLLDRSGWAHGWTTAAGPDFHTPPDAPDHAAAVASLSAAVGLDDAAWVRQVHGGTVLRAEGPGCLGEADALWSDRPGLGVVGRSADCPLVIVTCDSPSPRWGFAHASWRSTVAGITAELMAALKNAGTEPTACRAVIGPSAGPCCYEVGDEVREQACESLGKLAEAFFVRRGERWLLDLWRVNVAQLIAAGVPGDHVQVTGVCTICSEGYPSYRRDGAAAGRFAAMVGHA